MLLPWIVLLVVIIAVAVGIVAQLKRRIRDKTLEHKAPQSDRDDAAVTGRR